MARAKATTKPVETSEVEYDPTIQATATLGKNPDGTKIEREVEVKKNLGASLEECIELWGEKVCYNRLHGALVIDVQGQMRKFAVDALDKDGNVSRKALTDGEIQAKVDEWSPSIKTSTRKSDKEKTRDYLMSLTPEARAELLSQYL